jgi:hypothetical protein
MVRARSPSLVDGKLASFSGAADPIAADAVAAVVLDDMVIRLISFGGRPGSRITLLAIRSRSFTQ